MVIVYTCQACHQETEDTLTQEHLIHGNSYELRCTHCGKPSELSLAIYQTEDE